MPRRLLLVLLLASAAGTAAAQVKRVTRPLLRPTQYRGMRFFPSLKWRVTLGMAAHTVPAVADLDLDGRQDLLVPAADGALYRLTDNGDVVWKRTLIDPDAAEEPGGKAAPEGGASRPMVGATLADVDRDGALDILVATGRTLHCLNADGRERWKAELEAPIQSFVTVADLDRDGQPELLLGANDNRLHVLNGQGAEKWSYETKSWIVGGAAVADLNGDGRLDVVFGSMDFKVYCLTATGELQWEFETGDWVQSSPCIADVDRDGKRDVVVASDDGYLYCLNGRGGLKWKEALAGAQRTPAYLAVGDLDGEGTLETVATLPNGQVQVFTAFGDRAWTRGVSGGIAASPVIADLNGDGWQDLLLVTQGGRLVSMDTWGGTQWDHYLGHSVEATPLLTDVDRDGKYEVYVANLTPSRKGGFFSQYELSVAGGKVLWATLKGDPARTGYAPNATDYAAALRRGGDYATAWEPFQAGYRPRTGVPAPRRVRMTALPLEDRGGNRDGALDPGETALFRVQVTNHGAGATYDSLLLLDLAGSRLQLDRTSMYLGWIAPKATKTVTFRLTAPKAEGLPEGSSYGERLGGGTIALRLKESGVLAALADARVIKVPPLPPQIHIREKRLLDAPGRLTAGNGNGILDAGESAVLRLILQNENLTTARTAVSRLTSGSTDVLVATPAAIMNRVLPGGGRRVEFALRVAKRTQARSVSLTLTTTSPGAPPTVDRITLPLRPLGVDVTPPVVRLTSPPGRIARTRRDQATLAGTLTDPSGIVAFRLGKESLGAEEWSGAGAGRYRFHLTRELKPGENVFPFIATDGAGNTLSFWVRIVRQP